MKNRKYAGQQAKRARGGEGRGGKGSGYLCLAASTCKNRWGQPSLCWVQQQPHHLQQQLQLLRVATISRSMLHNAKNWSRDQRAGAELRTAVGLQPGPGPPQLHSSRPSCNRFPVPQPPPPCHSCLHGNHSPYTTYTIKHTHHMHTVIWNTHTHSHTVSIHNWAAEYAKEFSKRAIKIVFFN